MNKIMLLILLETDLNLYLLHQFARRRLSKDKATLYAKSREGLKVLGYIDKEYEITENGKRILDTMLRSAPR